MAYTGIYSPAPQNAFNLERAAMRGVAHEAEDARKELRRGYVEIVFGLSLLKESGVDIGEAVSTLDAEIAKRDKALTKTIDAAGRHYDEFDQSELRALA